MRYRGRKGITLLEVLVSIFILTIGMLALLTLFLLGARNMARALQDDRASSAANVAAELAVAKDLRHDPALFARGDPFLDPAPNAWPAVPQGSTGPSYPVLIDPYAVRLGPNSLGQVPAGAPAPFTATAGIPRFGASYAPTARAINRWFSLQDDVEFGEDALPPGEPVEKGGRYTWAYLLRRPRAFSDAMVDMWVIVYDGRDTWTSPPAGEETYPAQGTRGTNTVVIAYGAPAPADPPATRKGTWILDVTTDPTTHVTQGHFYRVVNVSNAGANQLVLEVDPPLKADMTVAVVMENAIDVFEKGSSWRP